MTITRIINGQLHWIELTPEESEQVIKTADRFHAECLADVFFGGDSAIPESLYNKVIDTYLDRLCWSDEACGLRDSIMHDTIHDCGAEDWEVV